MKTRTILTALGVVTLMGTALSAVPATAEPLDLQVQSVTFDKTSVSVSGLKTAPVTVTLKATYKLGKPNQPMYAEFESYDSQFASTWVVSEPLKLIDGTGTDGTWQGIVNVPSTADGNLRATGAVAGVYTGTYSDGKYDSAPIWGPKFAVQGLHVPRITRTVSANPVPFGKPYSITWKIIDTSTGKPYGTRLTVLATKGPSCLEVKGSPGAARTNAAGALVVNYAAADADQLNCLLIPTTQAPSEIYALAPNRPGVVAATPEKTSAKVGTTVAVNGKVYGFTYECTVNLQRLSGKTQWRTQSSAKVRVNGRYTLAAPITAKGAGTFRVQFPACHQVLAGVSKNFTITGV
ncbi:hypothetical protein OG474_16675 [Kribbella sp. NBC_01505]|uniref:hypothetical protein n=1 Tax=Kribbella sp. NBC_01505 TaxID=2903580 RepID=UPI00386DD249